MRSGLSKRSYQDSSVHFTRNVRSDLTSQGSETEMQCVKVDTTKEMLDLINQNEGAVLVSIVRRRNVFA